MLTWKTIEHWKYTGHVPRDRRRVYSAVTGGRGQVSPVDRQADSRLSLNGRT